MQAPETDESLTRLREALQGIAERARELECAAREAVALADRLSDGTTHQPSASAGLEPRQAALLVAVTLRGGTVDADVLSALASRLAMPDAAMAELFAGPEPHLVRRAAGAAGLTERGLEAAASWRAALPEDLRSAASDL